MADLYPFLGTSPRFYSQYLDVTNPDGPQPLTAEPGESYSIARGPGYEDKKGESTLTLPPADGLWGDPVKEKSDTAARPSKKGANN